MASRELWRRTFSAMHRPLKFPAATPASLHQAKRGFAAERPEDSSTSNWGTGEPPIDEKATKRGVDPGTRAKGGTLSGTSSDSDGEVPTPNLSRQKITRDFINTKREERMKASQEATSPEVKRQQQVHDEVKETGAAHPGDMAGG
jgi:hypothetical protein